MNEPKREERTTPAGRSVDSRRLLAFLDDVEAAGLELHTLILWRSGAIVAEGWRWPYSRDRLRITHSMTKSFTACAIGLLIEDGKLALDNKVADFFPEIDLVAESPHRRMTVEDLLTMRTGHDAEVSGAVWRGIATSWIAEFFRIPIVHEPGTHYRYSSAASYMLSAIASRVTGETMRDYLEPRLFAPLGIRDYDWAIGPDGINPGGNGITMKSVDCMKLGILHAQGGVWEGRRILPAWWVEAATRPQGSETYGYHWVIGPSYYAALGQFVQMCAVFPESNAVLMINAAIRESKEIRPLIARHFPAAFEGAVDAGADATLAERLAGWSQVMALESETGDMEPAALSGRWLADPNPLGIEAVSVAFDGEQLTLTLAEPGREQSVSAPEGGWSEVPTSLPAASLHHGYTLEGTPTLAGYRWLAADRLELVLHFVESAFRDRITLARDGDGLRLDRKVNINSGDMAWPTLSFRRG